MVQPDLQPQPMGGAEFASIDANGICLFRRMSGLPPGNREGQNLGHLESSSAAALRYERKSAEEV